MDHAPGQRAAGHPGWLKNVSIVIAAVAVIAALVVVSRTLSNHVGNGVPPGVVQSAMPGTDPGDGDTRTGGQGQPVDGVKCDSGEQLAFHVHAHVYVLDDGISQPIAAHVGIVGNGLLPTCFYWLHTHDRSGLIHMEAPGPQTFTLGQFFDIWGQPLDPTRVAGLTVPSGQPATVYVDGKVFPGDPRTIELKRHTQVVIELGRLVSPPTYDFGQS